MAPPTFYVASPLGDRTAGPEALTQLVDAIRRRGVNAFLVPMYNFRGRTNDPEYDVYDFEVAERIPKAGDSYFVMTEVSPIESFRELRTVPPERTWIAWLSVNFSPDPRARHFRPSENCCPTFPPEVYQRADDGHPLPSPQRQQILTFQRKSPRDHVAPCVRLRHGLEACGDCERLQSKMFLSTMRGTSTRRGRISSPSRFTAKDFCNKRSVENHI